MDIDTKTNVGNSEKISSNFDNRSKQELDESHLEIDTVAEKRLLRKLDWTLLPMFTLIFCCNFIDRTAVGNARIAGLEKDLHLQGADLNVTLTVFYVCYIISDIPSNLILRRFGSIWLAFLVIVFGLVTLGSAFMRSFSGLMLSRLFLGLSEGGILSGLVYILARFYRRSELVFRIGIFLGLAPSLAGAFGGLLASGLLRISDFGVMVRWRKIFFVEGIITTIIGFLLLFIIPSDPKTTRMFNEEERRLAIARMDADQVVKSQGRQEKVTFKLVMQSFNFNTTVCAICFSLINVSFQGLSLFLPTVVNNLGHFSTVEAQLRTVPPFLVGAVYSVFASYISLRMKQRFLPILVSMLLMVIGYVISITTQNAHARYAACFLLLGGSGPAGPLILTWGTDNAAPDAMRAVATGAIPGIGGLGSILAVWTYIPSDGPNYHKGNSINLATTSAVCALATVMALYIRWENAKRGRGERDYRLEGKSAEQIEQMGCRHPRYLYQT